MRAQAPLRVIQSETAKQVEPLDMDAAIPGRMEAPHRKSPAKHPQMRVPGEVEPIEGVQPSPGSVVPWEKAAEPRRAETLDGGGGRMTRSRPDNQEIRASPIPGIFVPPVANAQTLEGADPGRNHRMQSKPESVVWNGEDQQPKSVPPIPIVPAPNIAPPRTLASSDKQEHAVEISTIHVTIGRVEVRATLPPPVRSRQQAAQPRGMSLDEYLRQRASGGSR